MSQQATFNIVDNEEMSSQGSVNAPVAPPHSPTQGQATTQTPTAPLPFLSSVLDSVQTQQSGVARMSHAMAMTIPVQSTEVVVAPTMVVDAPTRAETKQAFDEVSFALRSVLSQHDAVYMEVQQLSCGMEQMRQERTGEVESTA